MLQSHSVRRGNVPALEMLEDRLTPSSTDYVTALYANLLHRTAQPSEVAGWVAILDSGTPPSAVATAFVNSAEYQGNFIRSSYQLFLNRQPSLAEVNGWLGSIGSGQTDQQVEAAFLASNEFIQAHPGGNNAWINAVYEQVLARPADAAGLASWAQALADGATYFDVAFAIVNSSEEHSRVVNDAYHLCLGRSPDASGQASWVGAVNGGLAPDEMLVGLVCSAEYLNLCNTGNGGGGAGTGPFFDDPFCDNPYDFPSLGGGGGGNTGGGGGGGSTGGGGGGGGGGSTGGGGGGGSTGGGGGNTGGGGGGSSGGGGGGGSAGGGTGGGGGSAGGSAGGGSGGSASSAIHVGAGRHRAVFVDHGTLSISSSATRAHKKPTLPKLTGQTVGLPKDQPKSSRPVSK